MSSNIEFENLVADYYQALYQFAYSLTKTPDAAADLTQQTFLIWAQKGNSLREISKVKSWLFTTMYREFLRLYRRAKKVQPIDQDLLQTRPDLNLVESARALEGKDAMEALLALDPIYREPLTLFYLEDLAYKEISDVLDIPIGTVMSRLSRGKAQLKAALSEKFSK